MMKLQVIALLTAISILAIACDGQVTSEDLNVYVAPQTILCGSKSQYNPTDTCLQVRERIAEPYEPAKIDGFVHEIGFNYKLRVRATTMDYQRQSFPYTPLKLLEMLEKTPAP